MVLSSISGHLDPAFKALFLAAAHAVKGWPEQTRAAVTLALDSGVPGEKIWAVASLVPSSRGSGPAELLAAALLDQGIKAA